LFTKYRLPGELSKLSIGGGLNWESSNYTLTSKPDGNGEFEPARLRQGGYSLVSLLAKYDISEQLSAQVNVNNLFDKRYYSQIGFYDQLAFGAPRNVLASLKYQF
jgi:outer membrane receptor for ferric coprogen and ferric-rhodotorulic acid